MAAKHKVHTQQKQSNTTKLVYNYRLQLHSVNTCRVSAWLGACKIGENLAQHTAGTE